jgi:hypothetical protein
MSSGFCPHLEILPREQKELWPCAPAIGCRWTSATKLKVILQRAEAKDYLDIAVLLDRGISLANGLACAGALYGSAFQPSEALKALVYFEDGDLPQLPGVTRRLLCEAMAQLQELPPLPPVHARLV